MGKKPIAGKSASVDLRPGLYRLQTEVGQALGMKCEKVRQLEVAGMPVNPDGTYDLVEIMRWKIPREMKGNGSAEKNSAGGDGSGKSPDEIGVLLDNATKALKLQQLAGRLIDRPTAIAEKRRQNATIATVLMGLPDAVAPDFPAGKRAEYKNAVAHRVYLMMKQLHLGDEEVGTNGVPETPAVKVDEPRGRARKKTAPPAPRRRRKKKGR